MTEHIDVTQIAITAAVAVADAPFAELEVQAARLAGMALDGFLSQQQAADIARTAGFAAGLVHRHGEDVVQEAIAWGFERALQPMEAPPIAPAKATPQLAKREYRTPESTIDAFWYVVRSGDKAALKAWLADRPKDAPTLRKLWEAKCHQSM